MKRRHFILLLGGGSSGVLTAGTGAFSNVQAERGVAVSVANDRTAYVGYQSDDQTLPDDSDDSGRVTLVTVTNRFKQNVRIADAVLEEGANSVTEVHIPDTEITPGDSAEITATSALNPGDTVEIAVTVSVEGTGVAAEVFGDTGRRRFTLTRKGSAGSESRAVVKYNGKGTIKVREGDDREDPTTVDLYTVPQGNSSEDALSSESVDVVPGKNQNFSKRWVVAVVIDGTVYQHPGWDDTACEFTSPGSGEGVVVEDPPSC